jgi:hypothetical protein
MDDARTWRAGEIVPLSKFGNHSNQRNLSKQDVLNTVLVFADGNGKSWKHLDATLWRMNMEILRLVDVINYFCVYTVTCIPIARQRLGKHVPAVSMPQR